MLPLAWRRRLSPERRHCNHTNQVGLITPLIIACCIAPSSHSSSSGCSRFAAGLPAVCKPDERRSFELGKGLSFSAETRLPIREIGAV